MGNIQLSIKGQKNYTTISNQFIDSYMPSANGSFVKVYLYLLRNLSKPGQSISISGMADCFENTEKDILRALKYWEKMNLLEISKDSKGEISNIELVEPEEKEETIERITALNSSDALEKTEAIKNVEKIGASLKPAVDFTNLEGNPELTSLLQIIETYLSRMLKPQDIENISFFYNELHFTPDLIEHLYDYCVSRGKKTSSYIKAVAAMWAQEGIHTREEAMFYSQQYNEVYNEIKKAFSFQRMLGEAERKMADRWHREYKSPIPLIKEACDRSILNTGKPDFNYADKILKNWAKKGISTIEQVNAEDEDYKKTGISASGEKRTASRYVQTMPREKQQNFKQRSYSSEEISSMEKNLLKKKLST